MNDEKKYMIVFNASEARKIMKLGRCFPVDIKKNKNPKENDKPSVFIFENLEDKEFKVVCNPATARELLKSGHKMIDIKKNARPYEGDCATVFVFEKTVEFVEDFNKIKNSENDNGGN